MLWIPANNSLAVILLFNKSHSIQIWEDFRYLTVRTPAPIKRRLAFVFNRNRVVTNSIASYFD